jgi:hypothetical protein
MLRPLDSKAAWARHLRHLCLPVLSSTPLDPAAHPTSAEAENTVATFRDEFGHRRTFDRLVLAWRLGVAPPASGESAAPTGRTADLWIALATRDLRAQAVAVCVDGTGPVTPEDPGLAIEIWSEAELAALHALDRIAGLSADTMLADRVSRAVDWHTANLQPDNATNRPWASHVFVKAAVERGDSASMLHAETLVSNCCVSMGRPDRFSAILLLDSAEALDADG